MLITLAACLAMIQANLLLSVSGKTDGFFADMDVLRLPLGILTGVGFIGGGAILRRGDGITGVTTAATIWIMTVIGLCLGGGQIWLGCIATAAAFVIIVPIKFFDRQMARELGARITLRVPGGTDPIGVTAAIAKFDYEVRLSRLAQTATDEVDLSFELNWLASRPTDSMESMLKGLGAEFKIISLEIASSAA